MRGGGFRGGALAGIWLSAALIEDRRWTDRAGIGVKLTIVNSLSGRADDHGNHQQQCGHANQDPVIEEEITPACFIRGAKWG